MIQIRGLAHLFFEFLFEDFGLPFDLIKHVLIGIPTRIVVGLSQALLDPGLLRLEGLLGPRKP